MSKTYTVRLTAVEIAALITGLQACLVMDNSAATHNTLERCMTKIEKAIRT